MVLTYHLVRNPPPRTGPSGCSHEVVPVYGVLNVLAAPNIGNSCGLGFWMGFATDDPVVITVPQPQLLQRVEIVWVGM